LPASGWRWGTSALNVPRVWLIDDPSPAVNPNLDFVLNDAAAALGRLR